MVITWDGTAEAYFDHPRLYGNQRHPEGPASKVTHETPFCTENYAFLPGFSSEKNGPHKIRFFLRRKARGAYPTWGIDGEDLKGAGNRRSGL